MTIKSSSKISKPRFNFDLNDLQQSVLHAVKRSADTGSRSLYLFEYEGRRYWLKLQEQTQAENEAWRLQGFEQETQFYQTYSNQKWILPYQILQIPAGSLANQRDATGLILTAADPVFGSLASECTKDEIVHQIFLMLNALQGIHEQGWIHADLKKQHFIQYGQQVCLLDFEQTQKIGSINTDTSATPYYMAPELFHGAAKSVQTDLYALGIILLEWLSGKRLHAASYEEWAILHCQSLKIELPEQRVCFYPLLLRLLARKASQRFTDIYAVQRMLMTEIA